MGKHKALHLTGTEPLSAWGTVRRAEATRAGKSRFQVTHVTKDLYPETVRVVLRTE